MEKHFVGFVDSEGRNAFINIALIRHAALNTDGSLDIWFDLTHWVHFEGAHVREWFNRLVERAVAVNGDALLPLGEAALTKDGTSQQA